MPLVEEMREVARRKTGEARHASQRECFGVVLAYVLFSAAQIAVLVSSRRLVRSLCQILHGMAIRGEYLAQGVSRADRALEILPHGFEALDVERGVFSRHLAKAIEGRLEMDA